MLLTASTVRPSTYMITGLMDISADTDALNADIAALCRRLQSQR